MYIYIKKGNKFCLHTILLPWSHSRASTQASHWIDRVAALSHSSSSSRRCTLRHFFFFLLQSLLTRRSCDLPSVSAAQLLHLEANLSGHDMPPKAPRWNKKASKEVERQFDLFTQTQGKDGWDPRERSPEYIKQKVKDNFLLQPFLAGSTGRFSKAKLHQPFWTRSYFRAPEPPVPPTVRLGRRRWCRECCQHGLLVVYAQN